MIVEEQIKQCTFTLHFANGYTAKITNHQAAGRNFSSVTVADHNTAPAHTVLEFLGLDDDQLAAEIAKIAKLPKPEKAKESAP